MYIYDFDQWCRQATKGIKYGPDRKEVHWELYQHMNDRFEDFSEQDISYESAVEGTLQAMGDPAEVAPLLAAIHRPFWGYLYSFCKWLFLILTIFMLWYMIPFTVSTLSRLSIQNYFGSYNPYTDHSYNDGLHEWKQIFYDKPNCSASSDGYTFIVTDAALWQASCSKPESCSSDHYQFHCRMKAINAAPWTRDTDIGYWFKARDSEGHSYQNMYEGLYNDPVILPSYRADWIFIYTCDMFTHNFISQEAEWIELYYDRSDRDISLQIDLTGGAAE